MDDPRLYPRVWLWDDLGFGWVGYAGDPPNYGRYDNQSNGERNALPRVEETVPMTKEEFVFEMNQTLNGEADPSGKLLKEAGAKADAGKPSVTRGCLHYFPRALSAVATLSMVGANKYSWKGWESVPDGIHRYSDALGRHELKIEDDFTRIDNETGVLECTAVAWNALARLELILRGQEAKRG